MGGSGTGLKGSRAPVETKVQAASGRVARSVGPIDPPRGGPGRRELRRPALWFSDGTRKKTEARRAHRCVECDTALPSGRTPYCGRRCQWRFQGRYFWDAARTFVIHRDRFTCQICRTRRRVRDLEVDHIVEIARGGGTLAYENLQTLCRSCHRAKTAAFLRAYRRRGDGALPTGPEHPPEGPEFGEWFPA
jgi:5-methylcytosine-specific restriction endonuclease McrA